eukprot:1190002-Prorocentrum_minimum.AAC.3
MLCAEWYTSVDSRRLEVEGLFGCRLRGLVGLDTDAYGVRKDLAGESNSLAGDVRVEPYLRQFARLAVCGLWPESNPIHRGVRFSSTTGVFVFSYTARGVPILRGVHLRRAAVEGDGADAARAPEVSGGADSVRRGGGHESGGVAGRGPKCK